MKRIAIIVLLFAALFNLRLAAQTPKLIKVACIGNSITEGYGLKDSQQESYPAVLSKLLGKEYAVGNFGVSGRTLLNNGDVPYMRENKYGNALDYQPDIVTIKLGTNDSKPQNWKYKNEFQRDLEAMVDTFLSLSTHPDIYLCMPVPAFSSRWNINDSVIYNGIIPIIKSVATKKGVHVIDLYTPLKPCSDCFPDGIHPNAEGAKRIAEVIYQALTRKNVSGDCL